MKNQLVLLIGIVVLMALLAFMFTYQVRYDQVAVLTTFGQTTPPAYDEQGRIVEGETGSLVTEPGLYFQAPWPIQRVYTYPRRIQTMEGQLEEIQTDDGFAVVVRPFMTWRIADPYTFYQNVETIPEAQRQLNGFLRDLTGVLSNYRFSDMVNRDEEALKLDEIEAALLAYMGDRLAGARLGIEVVEVGIRRKMLPEETTQTVFEAMRATRERMAATAREQGLAEASTIRSDAESAREQILAFAESRAQEIRNRGTREAASYFARFAEDEDFAIFLRQIEALEQMLEHNTTFVLDASSLWVFDIFRNGPGSEDYVPAAEIDPRRNLEQAVRETREMARDEDR